MEPQRTIAGQFVHELITQQNFQGRVIDFGSCLYGLGMLHSDADMCIEFKKPISTAEACVQVRFTIR